VQNRRRGPPKAAGCVPATLDEGEDSLKTDPATGKLNRFSSWD